MRADALDGTIHALRERIDCEGFSALPPEEREQLGRTNRRTIGAANVIVYYVKWR